jgi:hypothetical protein
MSDDDKYVTPNMEAMRRNAQYVQTVLACIANFIVGKPSYSSVSDARYAVNEAQERMHQLTSSLEDI